MIALQNEWISIGQTKIDSIEKRSVTVLHLPVRFSSEAARGFIRDVEECVNAGRPYVVLDCSTAGQLDKPMAGLFLHCLQETMKRNGDVKLVCISLTQLPALGLAGATRLFEVFDTVNDAVDSFHQFSSEMDGDASESAA